jgi:hypothetical protein
MDNETLASLLRGRNRAGQPVDATANIIGPAMSALGNTIYGAGRGALTAMAGLPGDINQLITDNLGTLVNAQGLPTTKEIQDFLPAKPTTYEGKLAQKLGEFVPVNPTPIAKGAVAIAKPVGKAMGEQAYRMTEDMLQKQGMMPSIVAYHGTPHNIEGAFDISKVGTGEGAQAYGHGMYYAENPNVATEYQKRLSGKTTFGERPSDSAYVHAVESFRDANYPLEQIPAEMKKAYKSITDKDIQLAIQASEKGNLYKVDIPDADIPNMLNWDLPINQQSAKVQEIAKQLDPNLLADTPHLIVRGQARHWTEVVDSLEDLQNPKTMKLLKKIYGEGAEVMPYGDYLASKMTGEQLYRNLSNPTQWAKEAAPYAMKAGMEDAAVSAKLNELGVKGIRYKDAMSRNADEGTSNFVVFDPKEVKILEKNSKPVSRKDIIEEQVNNLK